MEKGIVDAAENGYLAGFPMVDFKVTVYDGSYHDVDSSELAFKLAARKAFKAAMLEAKPSLLEPIMNVEIQAPVEYAGDLMGDLNSRRGRISGMDTKGSTQFIRAQVPMSEMLNYQSDLTAMTQGRASFTMEFDHYDYVPQLQADKIIAAAKAPRMGEEEEEEELEGMSTASPVGQADTGHGALTPSWGLQLRTTSYCGSLLGSDRAKGREVLYFHSSRN